MKQLSPKNW